MNDNDAVIKKAFEKPDWYLTSTAYNIRIRCETIREFTKGAQYDEILDIGCGDGSLSLQLLTAENRVTLLDRSTGMLEKAVKRIPEGLASSVTVVNEDFLTASLGSGQFDLIICVGVMAYVNDPEAFIRKLADTLRAGGTLILECTDGNHPLSYFSRAYLALRQLWKNDGIFKTAKRSSDQLLMILRKCGFNLSGMFRYSLPLPGLRKLLSQRISYGAVRTIFGKARKNRMRSLGNECLFRLDFVGEVGSGAFAAVKNPSANHREASLVKG